MVTVATAMAMAVTVVGVPVGVPSAMRRAHRRVLLLRGRMVQGKVKRLSKVAYFGGREKRTLQDPTKEMSAFIYIFRTPPNAIMTCSVTEFVELLEFREVTWCSRAY